MKKLLFSVVLIASAPLLTAQTENANDLGIENGQGVIHWKLDGNSANDNHFMGTTNETPLIFKSNMNEGLRINPDGEVQFNNLNPIPDGELGGVELPAIAVINKNGALSYVNVNQLVGLIYQNDCWGETVQDQNGNSGGGIGSGGGGSSVKPTWENDFGKIYTGSDCPAKVGINTSTPTSTLDVRGTSYFTNTMHIRFSETSVGKAFYISNPDGDDAFRINGNGTVWATEVNVRVKEDFPDYVFASDYYLMPLSELKLYIAKEGHLPNIPKADTVEEEGMNLGEMNRLLLEKVEELTLYTIQLSEEIEKLKALQENEK